MKLDEIIRISYETAKDKGWWDTDRGIPECLALIHSEVSEALEDYRDGKMVPYLEEKKGAHKPCGFPSELADIIIRVADLAGRLDIDLTTAVALKMSYNATRPVRHGGKAA